MPPRTALRPQFIRSGHKMPVTRSKATSAVFGIGGHEGLTLDIALNKVLHAYWRDPTIPAHLPKELPVDRTEAQRLLKFWNDRLTGSAA
jgi:hypothetical protein